MHLGHANIVKYSRGMFASVQEMDSYIIRQWNEHTDTTDDIWILGNLSYRSTVSVSYYLEHMKWMKSVDLPAYEKRIEQELSQTTR